MHFLENEPNTGNSFIGSSEVSGEVGYDRFSAPTTRGPLVYGYQGFQFSTGVTFHSQVIQLMWGHRITGRLDFLIGADRSLHQLDHLPTAVTNPTSRGHDPSLRIVGRRQSRC